ncbi:MAG: PAS domain-containing protein [Acidobacteriaceae bacterium]|nr:PAS domain-containing protein [Acidobacteriaceae bacterium]
MSKVFRYWLLLMLSLPVALWWLWSDLKPGATAWAAFKIAVIISALSAAAVAIHRRVLHRLSGALQRLENFVAAVPRSDAQLAEDGPIELEHLSRAMRAMSQRIRDVVESVNLESTRRQAILACMAEAVLAVDRNLRVVFCNNAFSQAFVTRVPEPEGRALYEVVREPVLRDVLERVVRTRSPEKASFQFPTAGNRWFEARALPFASGPGRGAVIVLHDTTDIKHQEQMRKDFVADVSHELRTPLTAIRGYAETLMDGAIDDKENGRRFVQIILSHAIRLNNIATDLLVLSELDSNAPPEAPPQRVSVAEVVESAVNIVQHAASSRGIRLLRDCHHCHVTGYRFRLEQALVNLLDNAVKFNRDNGEVRVDCSRTEDGHVAVSVADTGVGIPTSELKRIFQRFYRVDKARARPAGGTGLGLPIVKEVIERMGGTVTVESQLGRGSKFTLLLDAAPE